MMKRAMFQLTPVLCAAAAGMLLMAGPAKAAVTYTVTVNTAAVSGSSGFLDFQLNPGNASSQPVTATISAFAGGVLVGAPSNLGNISGALPSTVTMVNSTPLNEVFQGIHFGTILFFVVTLSGPGIDTPNGLATAGTTFGIGLYDSTPNPILTNQGSLTGFAGQIDIQLNGTTTGSAFPTATSGPSVVSFVSGLPPVPTLSAWGLTLLSMMLYAFGAYHLGTCRTSAGSAFHWWKTKSPTPDNPVRERK
jgi:hypothetical protein